ncbi:MAG: hypothetical protein G01um101413_731 [Parcubacteria group bacterium Gr01-1014_13]|nr:MAG: hypothetical protein G01um101413_731 [Parcubacteria group bacterium Gr01-1014_13]
MYDMKNLLYGYLASALMFLVLFLLAVKFCGFYDDTTWIMLLFLAGCVLASLGLSVALLVNKIKTRRQSQLPKVKLPKAVVHFQSMKANKLPEQPCTKVLAILSFGAFVAWNLMLILFVSYPRNGYDWFLSFAGGGMLISPAIMYGIWLVRIGRYRRGESKLVRAIVVHSNGK